MNKKEGLKLAIRYSIVPCHLGLCGPLNDAEKKDLDDFLKDKKIAIKKIIKILEKIKDAHKYCQKIAKENDIEDMYDYRIIEAYWLGNSLLSKLNNKWYHNFHVYQVAVLAPAKLRDTCRISWGQIIEVNPPTFSRDIESYEENLKSSPPPAIRPQNILKGGRIKKDKNILIVEYEPIVKQGEKFVFAKEKKKKRVSWDKKILPENIKIGDYISIHWNTAIEKLSKKRLANLKRYTVLSIKPKIK